MSRYRFAINVTPKPGILDPQGRAVEGAAGEATVVVAVIEGHPALVPLALDVGEAGLPLRIQRVERLVQSFLGALAAVDRAADLARRGIHPAVPFGRRPKNNQPFHRVPAIALATADKDL